MTIQRFAVFLLVSVLFGACTLEGEAEPRGKFPQVRMVEAFPNLAFDRPVWVGHAGDDSGRLFVVEQVGRIHTFEEKPGIRSTRLFLDIADRVRRAHNEEGLLALAFHPKFPADRRFFVYYSASNPRRGVLASFEASASDPERAVARSERVILEVPQPFGNHNGADLRFGPDGYLYVSLGDGGGAGDPMEAGQDLSTLLATILRIDIDRTAGGKTYAVPADNPFVDRKGARPEIWAYGLRNVWRMSFDADGNLWAGDVGQDAWEEIDIIVKGGNYGWNLREGAHDFRGGGKREALIDPVFEYSHRDGQSVTGGFVCRDPRLEKLQGCYILADYVSGTLWALRHEKGTVTDHGRILEQPKNVSTFGEGKGGELYLATLRDGKIWRLEEKP